MLTTSSGAVAVYFAILKYLGWEKADLGATFVVLTVVPPVLLLIAAVTFALALRPSLTFVERSEYAEFRARSRAADAPARLGRYSAVPHRVAIGRGDFHGRAGVVAVTLPAPSECADWFERAFERGAGIMIDPRAADLRP